MRRFYLALIAQLVEQLPLKQTVAGSNPAGGTILRVAKNALRSSLERSMGYVDLNIASKTATLRMARHTYLADFICFFVSKIVYSSFFC